MLSTVLSYASVLVHTSPVGAVFVMTSTVFGSASAIRLYSLSVPPFWVVKPSLIEYVADALTVWSSVVYFSLTIILNSLVVFAAIVSKYTFTSVV